VNQPTNLRDPNNRLPLTFNVTFAEPVVGFDQSDVTMGGTATGVTCSVTGSGAEYVIHVTAVTGAGTLIPSIAAGVCQGVWGGINVASTGTDNSVTYDPTLALAMFSAAPREGGAPLTVQFRDESILGTLPIVNWQWEFGDGETSDQPNPKHVYQEPGDYTVSLTVSTINGSDMWTENDYIAVRQAIPLWDWTGIIALAVLLAFARVLVSRRAKE
jgi:PKD repeat protein